MSIDLELNKYYSNTLNNIDISIKAASVSKVLSKEEIDCFIQVLADFRCMVERGFNMKSNTMGHSLCVLLSKVALVFLAQPNAKSAMSFMYAINFNCDIFGDKEGRKLLADLCLAAMPPRNGSLQ